MEGKKNTIRILMVPYLAYGHISPFLELDKKLTNRNFHIYMCSIPVNLNSIKNVTEKYSQSIELVELHLPSLPNLPPRYHTTNGLPLHLMNTLKKAFQMSAPNFSKIIQDLNPDMIIYDFNQPLVAQLALSMNIHAVQFLPFAAALASLSIHVSENTEEKFLFHEIYLRKYEMLLLKEALNEAPGQKFPFDNALRRSRDIILVKTCRDIEGKYMDYLSNLVSKKIVRVGTLVQEPTNQDEDDGPYNGLTRKEKVQLCLFLFNQKSG